MDKKRLNFLEAFKACRELWSLIEAQPIPLEKAKEKTEADGTAVTEHPFPSADVHSHLLLCAFVKLYDCKDAFVVVDLLNDCLTRFSDAHQTPSLRVFTDPRTEYFCNREAGALQLYLVTEKIDHPRRQ